MDSVASVIVMLFALFALAGTLGYFVMDYVKHKDENTREFGAAQGKITAERDDRLSNLKFVVDQVNTVNQDIYTTVSGDVKKESERVTTVEKTQKDMLGGLDHFMKFGATVPVGSGAPPPPVSLTELPGHAAPNVGLIQHVTMTGGLTIADVSATPGSANRFEVCGSDSDRCIQFPDPHTGDTVLTTVDPQKNIRMDAKTTFTQSLELQDEHGTVSKMKQNRVGGSNLGYTSIETPMLAVANGVMTDPSATLHVVSSPPTPTDAFKVSIGASDAILVDATGNLVTHHPIQLKNGANVQGTILTDAEGLTIRASTLTIDGNLAVKGVATVNGKTVEVAAA